MTASFEASLSLLGAAKAQQLLDEAKAALAALSQADTEQEVARLASLPAAVREFYATKGLLYVGLKIINDAGQELHAEDPGAAGVYNLSILHRRAGKKKPPRDQPDA